MGCHIPLYWHSKSGEALCIDLALGLGINIVNTCIVGQDFLQEANAGTFIIQAFLDLERRNFVEQNVF